MRDTPAFASGRGRLADIGNLFQLNDPVLKSADYTLLASDAGHLFHDLTNAVTFTFAAALPIGWWGVFKHVANTSMVLAGSGATLNGAASLTADNTQDPTATALVIKTSATGFSVFLIGTWS